MISIILEAIMDVIATLFIKQPWYLAILYTAAVLSLAAASALIVINVVLLWLFSPHEANMKNGLVTVAAFAGIIAFWWAFFALARRTAAK